MDLETTVLPEVKVLKPVRHGDARGFFSEVWNAQRLVEAGIRTDFVQDNQSVSAKAGTIRGLHYQAPPHAQAKLVRCGRGAVWDVVVDVRRGSPTYGRWVGVDLTPENGRQVFVPQGFLHGFCTLKDDTEVLYKCSAYYDAEADGSVRYDSPALDIDWHLDELTPVLSDKDANAPDFSTFASPFLMEAA